MKAIREFSIKGKLTSVIMLTSCIALLAACAGFMTYEVLAFRANLVERLSFGAEVTGQNCSAAVQYDDVEDAQEVLAYLTAGSSIKSACIYRDGRLWAWHPPNLTSNDFPSGPAPTGYDFSTTRLALSHAVLQARTGRMVTVYLTAGLEEVYSRLGQNLMIVVVVLLVALVVALITSAQLQGMISKPILALSDTARAITEKKDYSVRAEKHGQDEVGALIDSFNEMLSQIEHRDIQLREARDAADKANKAKSNFLSFMSHELRTPLTSIIGFSEVLQTEVEAEKREAWADDLRRINDSGKYLLDLINDILDLSKIEAGKMEVHLETFRVGGLIRDITDVMRPLIENRSNKLIMEYGEDVGAMQSDRIKVRQCLLNLLSNAAKFTENGEIHFSAARSRRDGRDWLTFRMRDTGIGMTKDQMKKLFRAFSQGDTSTSRRYGGTGLGLALTRQFCQMLGGTVEVESELDKGSTFTIHLPAKAPGAGVPAMKETPARGGGSSPRKGRDCVLVIDDDPAVHEMVGEALEEEGYDVAYALSGAEGLKLAKELNPVAITLDVIMPQMDGWVVLSLLKADPELARIPVIMLTVCTEQDFAFAMGVADYLRKPIDREGLSAVFEKYHRLTPPIRVLVVENDPGMRGMLRRVLELEGWEVEEAENGSVAIERLDRSKPSLIILDILMPVMDGFELVAELQKREEWRRIPVVVLSAKELTPEDRARLQGYVGTILQKGSLGRDQLCEEVQQTVRTFVAARKN